MTETQTPDAEKTAPDAERTEGLVVVGVDDSEQARESLQWAAQIARERHWKLLIVHAWHMMYPVAPFATPPYDVEDAARDAAIEVVKKLEDEVLGPDCGIEVSHLVAQGPAGLLLVDASKDADLLVVGSRGRGGFASLTLGSVSSACVHHAHCPVLVMRPR